MAKLNAAPKQLFTTSLPSGWTATNTGAGGSVTIVTDQLNLHHTAGQANTSELLSDAAYDMVGSYAYCQVLNLPLHSGAPDLMYFGLRDPSGDEYQVRFTQTGTIELWKVISGTPSQVDTASWVRATTPFVRLRESGGDIIVETAADAGGGVPGTWAAISGLDPVAIDAGFDETQVQPFFKLVGNSALTNEDLKFDNFNSAEPIAVVGTLLQPVKVYDGTTEILGPSMDFYDPEPEGSVQLVVDTAEYASADVGSDIAGTVTAHFIGDDAGNYDLTEVIVPNGIIIARPITITAEDKQKTAGEMDPALTEQVTSMLDPALVVGESLGGALAREAGEDPGEYDILQGTRTAGTNYDETFEPGVLTIEEDAPDVECEGLPYPRYRLWRGFRWSRWKRKGWSTYCS